MIRGDWLSSFRLVVNIIKVILWTCLHRVILISHEHNNFPRERPLCYRLFGWPTTSRSSVRFQPWTKNLGLLRSLCPLTVMANQRFLPILLAIESESASIYRSHIPVREFIKRTLHGYVQKGIEHPLIDTREGEFWRYAKKVKELVSERRLNLRILKLPPNICDGALCIIVLWVSCYQCVGNSSPFLWRVFWNTFIYTWFLYTFKCS